MVQRENCSCNLDWVSPLYSRMPLEVERSLWADMLNPPQMELLMWEFVWEMME